MADNFDILVRTKMCDEAARIIDCFNDRLHRMYGHIQPDEDRSIRYGMRDFNGVPTCFIQNESEPNRDNLLVISAGTNDAFLDGWYKVKVNGTLMFNFATFDSAWYWAAQAVGLMACRVSMETVNLNIRVASGGADLDDATKQKITALEGDNDIVIHLIENSFWFENEADAVSFKVEYDEAMRRPENVV